MKARIEPWGAWVRSEDARALVALDHEASRALGIEGGRLWETPSTGARPPVEVHLAVTARCHAGCSDCYLDARPDGVVPEQGTLIRALDAMKEEGVFTVAFGGGEPITRPDLDALAEAARERGILPVLTTSGFGLSPSVASRLRSFAQVNVSFDGVGANYTEVRGFDGTHVAERAITRLVDEGIRVGVNVVLTRVTLSALKETVARALELGAVEVQLLRYKPEGRAASLDYLTKRLSSEQVETFPTLLRELVSEFPNASFRVDCALVPFLSSDTALTTTMLTRFGIFGCEAGESLAAVRIDGKVAPCSFAEPTTLSGEALSSGYGADPVLSRWRAAKADPAEPCASCHLRSVCKGGCKIVSRFIDREHGPDPECPRVRHYRL